MNFDSYWGDEDDAMDKPLAAEGRHTGEIVDVKEKRLEFMKSEANRDGASLVVTVSIPKAQRIEAMIPANYRGKIEALARAAGVAPPVRGEDWDTEQLVGRAVTVETVQAVSKKGTTYVRIEKWLASPSQPFLEKKAPARSQSAKAHREFKANTAAADDVPF